VSRAAACCSAAVFARPCADSFIDIRRRLVLLDLTMIATHIRHTASTTTT